VLIEPYTTSDLRGKGPMLYGDTCCVGAVSHEPAVRRQAL
jgi:hypothetical protein